MKLLSILLLGLLIASCSREKKEEDAGIDPPPGMTVEKNNGLNVPVLAELDTLNPPVLTFIETEFDFGTIDAGEIVNHEFKFKNTGYSPLIIVDAKSTCGCTIPSVSAEPVMPGKTGSIKVEFNSDGKSGSINKKITVSANTFPDPFTAVMLTGNVKK